MSDLTARGLGRWSGVAVPARAPGDVSVTAGQDTEAVVVTARPGNGSGNGSPWAATDDQAAATWAVAEETRTATMVAYAQLVRAAGAIPSTTLLEAIEARLAEPVGGAA